MFKPFTIEKISGLIIIVGFAALGLTAFAKRDSLLNRLYPERQKMVIYTKPESYAGNRDDAIWAKKLMSGGYILHFRHAERDKYIDVQMYDALESDVHQKGANQGRLAENEYFRTAVCLNERGTIQAKAIGEHLTNIKFPIGPVISSLSCRARQTADLAFGGFDLQLRSLVHIGPYSEDIKKRINDLKTIYQNLEIQSGKNTIVSAHNSVIIPQMFVNTGSASKTIGLEEGGFYVISRDPSTKALTLEHRFHNFRDFIRHFYKR